MSISQGRPKKNKAFKKMNNGHRKQRDRLPDRSKSTLLPGYLTTPDRAFKHMLAAAAPDGCQMMSWLDTAEKLRAARQLANTVNTLKYLKLQQQLWQEYDHVAIMEETCPSRITKTNAKAHQHLSFVRATPESHPTTPKNHRTSIETNRKGATSDALTTTGMDRQGRASHEFSRLVNSNLSMCGQRATTTLCRI